MVKTFKTRIYPTASQRDYIEQAFGVRRWTWNWSVAKYEELRLQGTYSNNFSLQKILNHEEVLDPAYSWLNDVNSMVRSEALKDFYEAMQAYYAKQKEAKKKGEQISPDKFKPTFKKKDKCINSFRMNNKRKPVQSAFRP